MNPEIDGRAASQLVSLLFDQPPEAANRLLYAVLDGARDPEVHPAIVSKRLASRCLFRGPIDPRLEANGPWLVLLPRDSEDARELVRLAWGKSWGIFLEALGDFELVARHLRGFLRVLGPAGQKMLFRYYDPRVLREYLPTTNLDEARRFSGPVRRFLMESADGHALLEDTPGPEGMVRRVVPLVEAAAEIG